MRPAPSCRSPPSGYAAPGCGRRRPAPCRFCSWPPRFFRWSALAPPDCESQFRDRLALATLDEPWVVGFVGQKGPATNLRLCLGTGTRLMQWPVLPRFSDAAFEDKMPAALILPAKAAKRLSASNYTIYPAGSVFHCDGEEIVLDAILQGNLQEFLGRQTPRLLPGNPSRRSEGPQASSFRLRLRRGRQPHRRSWLPHDLGNAAAGLIGFQLIG